MSPRSLSLQDGGCSGGDGGCSGGGGTGISTSFTLRHPVKTSRPAFVVRWASVMRVRQPVDAVVSVVPSRSWYTLHVDPVQEGVAVSHVSVEMEACPAGQ